VDGDTVIAVLPNHGLAVGDSFELVAPGISGFSGEYEVTAVSDKTFTFQAYSFFRPNPRGIATSQGTVFHDGNQTAYLSGRPANWQPNADIPFESSAGGYNGLFKLTKLGDNLYSFQVPFDDVRTGVHTDLKAKAIVLGRGDDELTIPGDDQGALQIDASAGGFDTLQISGNLAESLFLTNTYLANQALLVTFANFERLNLLDATRNLTLQGASAGQAINLGPMQLGVVAHVARSESPSLR
jgi:hypothetical protein